MKNIKQTIVWLILLFAVSTNAIAQGKAVSLDADIKDQISAYLTQTASKQTRVRPIRIDSAIASNKKMELYVQEQFSHIIFDADLVKLVYREITQILPKEYAKHKLSIYAGGNPIDNYIPFSRKGAFTNKVDKPLISNISAPYTISKGLKNRHIAMWQSHGWYYEQKLARWEWQRARIFQTVEDLYTQSYVLPYLVPMLENAGANILLPRERDTQKHEVIIDNDKSSENSTYTEINGNQTWKSGDLEGFAHLKEYYVDGENPFRNGTYREIKTVKSGDISSCQWMPNMPQSGQYGVYVSYKTVKNSADDAHYIVYHKGGKTEFKVNQTMGGGTWIFLGYFAFNKGQSSQSKIVLTNKASKAGKIVTADAIKIGGGMGNIARQPNIEGITENIKSSDDINKKEVKDLPKIEYELETSGYPRYTEAARYWLQWAGISDSIYSKSQGKNDYTDDYQSRGYWVNEIAGGSSILPKKEGLGIPIDLAMAFHSDAGTTMNDSIIGTLLICNTKPNDGVFANKQSRLASRDLASLMMDEIINDIRAKHNPSWTKRQIWDKGYSEATTPNVPTVLLELLSHQNLADMEYGLDPNFQFTVSRAVYKSMLKYLANEYKQDYVVQPLPINTFSSQFVVNNQVELKWYATTDSLETTAAPTAYILYTRINGGGFDNGVLVKGNSHKLEVETDKMYSFKVTAINDGGESFPSEILSVYKHSQEKGEILIVNGFDRVSAPLSFATKDSIGGFFDKIDHGVPYISKYNYIGSQYEFRRSIPWMDDDAAGFGASNADYETTVVAGNTFDYPSVHGASIAQLGYSFVSSSSKAVTNGDIEMNKYKMVDLILGKQKKVSMGHNKMNTAYQTFPKELQSKIASYCQSGGNIFVSGAHLASDLWDNGEKLQSNVDFATQILKYKWRVGQAAVTGKVKTVANPWMKQKGNFQFHNIQNEECYAIESPDALEPADKEKDAHTILRYSENNLSAGIAYKGGYKTYILGFPFETVVSNEQRNELMKNILNFIFE